LAAPPRSSALHDIDQSQNLESWIAGSSLVEVEIVAS